LVVPDWVRVRKEDFGLLFYDTRSTRLTFVRSGDALEPPPFVGGDRRLRRCPGAALTVVGTSGPGADMPGVATPGSSGPGQPGQGLAATARAAQGVAAVSMPRRLSDSLLRAPVNVTWEVTRACNLSCAHCLSADLRAGAPGGAPSPGTGEDLLEELDFAACCELVDELARLKVFQVNFGGGEPFLREDFLDLLAYCHSRGLTTCVSTNGTVLDRALVERLLELPAPVYLQVSLDGARPETNDAIRGRGTFARILKAVELLAASGYPDFSLNMVVTRLNVSEVGEFDRLARRYGAKTRLSRFRPSGAGCGTWEDLSLTKQQLRDLSAFLAAQPDILTGDSFFALTPAERRVLGLRRCGAARMTLAVAPEGSVYPCAFLCYPAFQAGNVRETPLSVVFRESSVLAQFRILEPAACRMCDRFSACHGGCPAVGYFLTRRLGVPDPECLRAVQRAGRVEEGICVEAQTCLGAETCFEAV